jgi:hypothetical protein
MAPYEAYGTLHWEDSSVSGYLLPARPKITAAFCKHREQILSGPRDFGDPSATRRIEPQNGARGDQMLNKWIITVALASSSISSAVAQSHSHQPLTVTAVAMRSADRLTSAAGSVISGNPEFGMLLCLGAVFVGSSAFFSTRRSEA